MQSADPEVAPVLDPVALTELRMLKLQDAIAAHSSDAIMREAHILKGSALAVGAARLARPSAAIEHHARAGLLDEAAARSTALASEFEEVRQALREGHG